jgi:hypothetical protein
MKKKLFLIAFTLFSALLFAQPVDPEGDPDEAVPITGIEWLLAGGCAFGLKKIIDNRRKLKGDG